MSREAPPSLHFARQWTQPTDFSEQLSRQTPSRVAYLPQRRDSLSPSSSSHSRSASTPSLLVQCSASRPTRKPLVASPSHALSSPSTSPLPVRPTQPSTSSSLFTEARPTSPRRRQTSPFVPSPSREDHVRRDKDDAVLQREGVDCLFWRQQAQRFEVANATLRQELNAIYRLLTETGKLTTGPVMSRKEVIEDRHLNQLEESHGYDNVLFPQQRRPHTSSPSGGLLSFGEALQERNMARIELAQEREKNFLLRHRLRETEVEVERLRQRLRAIDRRRDTQTSVASRAFAPARKRSGTATMQPWRPTHSQNHSASRATSMSPCSSSSTLSVAASSSCAVPSTIKAPSPHQRGASSLSRSHRATRCRSSQRNTCAHKSSGVTSEHSASERAVAPRPLRVYARLPQQKVAQACRSSSSSSTSAHHEHRRPSPLSPPRDKVMVNAQSSSSRAEAVAAVPSPPDSKARALLSSLLAAHPVPPLQLTLNQCNCKESSAALGLAETASQHELATPRQLFRSRLFGTTDMARDVDLSSKSSSFLSSREVRHRDAREVYLTRQLLSPTPPPRPLASPMEAASLSQALAAQHLSGNGTWMSVSLTTEEDSMGHGLPVKEDAGNGVVWPSTFRSFSL